MSEASRPNSIKPYHIRIIGLLLLQCPRTRISVYQRKTLPSHSSGVLCSREDDADESRRNEGSEKNYFHGRT